MDPDRGAHGNHRTILAVVITHHQAVGMIPAGTRAKGS